MCVSFYIDQFQNTHNLIFFYPKSTKCTQKYKISLIKGVPLLKVM